jgi:hypothetical protein
LRVTIPAGSQKTSLQGLRMRNLLAMTIVTVLALAAVAVPAPADARARWPAVPGEIGVFPVGRVGWFPYRCSNGPVYNFYHDALYDEAPAVYLGDAYRPYYRYTAWRVMPRTYFCRER